jgi:hypothetical protein
MRIFAMAVLLEVTIGAHAQHSKQPKKRPDPAAASWTKEPESVLGIKLGQEVPADSPPPCDPPRYSGPNGANRVMCIANRSAKVLLFDWQPIDFLERVSAVLQDGKVSSILLIAEHGNYIALKQMLIDRYGPPQRVHSNQAQTLSGATFDSETLKWLGRNVDLVVSEHAGSIEQSSAMFSHKKLTQDLAEELSRNTRNNAEKL